MMTAPWVTYFSRCYIIYDRDVSMGRNCVIWCLRVGVCESIEALLRAMQPEHICKHTRWWIQWYLQYIYFLLQKPQVCIPFSDCVCHHEYVWNVLLLKHSSVITLLNFTICSNTVTNKTSVRQPWKLVGNPVARENCIPQPAGEWLPAVTSWNLLQNAHITEKNSLWLLWLLAHCSSQP